MSAEPKIAVIIASLGRPDDIADQLEALQEQTRAPDTVILSVTDEGDLPVVEKRFGAEVLFGSKGLCAQRNRALEQISSDYDYIVFFDDDYLPAREAIAGIEAVFEAHPDVVGVNGHLIADGIHGPGISCHDALSKIAMYEKKPEQEITILRDLEGLYGCNMAYRGSLIGDTRFDENLPLYGWQEDIDFSNQLIARGRLVATNAFAGVHRGTKRGRSSGEKLGYSQIANVTYLLRKGSMPRLFGYKLMLRNFVANHIKVFRPEPWVDRKGRLIGNWKAIRDLLIGKIHPLKILDW